MYFSLFYFFIGLAVGSFINAAVYRVKTKKDWVWARSICPKCKHELAASDLVPLFSYLVLRAKCRYCKKKISMQYPVVEFITGALFFMNYQVFLRFPTTEPRVWGILGLLVIPLMVFIFVYDLKYRLILNQTVAMLYLLGLALIFSKVFLLGVPFQEVVWPAVLVGSLTFALFYSMFYFSKGTWMGGGDVKLMPAFALFFGVLAVQAIFLGFIIGSIYSIFLIAMHKKTMKSVIPFGPFLVLGFMLTYFLGDKIWVWFTLAIGKLLNLG